ncbi:nitric oxide synthase oxygenase [Bacillus horti]|uniref:Nitric oxide synthase oxygenase domain/subunit n=1 Tax=Caldalkalibacillus horti TaxID=77523 RepID=A0ABT9W0K7_9BACI|nr:nitric oxide synthase oxygenase [Bacillus horti]MDQ0166792.1 nitric oxide synthase oxygenase domain/subunit [Bacillus horti]
MEIYQQAKEFITKCYTEIKQVEKIESRLIEIENELKESGHYEHTAIELEHGAKMAWRNSNKCIGRLFWSSLRVIDAREKTSEEEVYQAIKEHIKFATNDGRIIPTITIFAPKVQGNQQFRLWNHQLIRYAGYEQ